MINLRAPDQPYSSIFSSIIFGSRRTFYVTLNMKEFMKRFTVFPKIIEMFYDPNNRMDLERLTRAFRDSISFSLSSSKNSIVFTQEVGEEKRTCRARIIDGVSGINSENLLIEVSSEEFFKSNEYLQVEVNPFDDLSLVYLSELYSGVVDKNIQAMKQADKLLEKPKDIERELTQLLKSNSISISREGLRHSGIKNIRSIFVLKREDKDGNFSDVDFVYPLLNNVQIEEKKYQNYEIDLPDATKLSTVREIKPDYYYLSEIEGSCNLRWVKFEELSQDLFLVREEFPGFSPKHFTYDNVTRVE